MDKYSVPLYHYLVGDTTYKIPKKLRTCMPIFFKVMYKNMTIGYKLFICPFHCFLRDFIYLFMRDTGRERESRDTGRGRSRLHVGSPMWDLIPGLQDHMGHGPKAGAKPLSHPGIPYMPIS